MDQYFFSKFFPKIDENFDSIKKKGIDHKSFLKLRIYNISFDIMCVVHSAGAAEYTDCISAEE